MEYHVIFIPLFPWETFPLRSFDDLKKLMKITGHLFGFQLLLREKKSVSNDNAVVVVSLAELEEKKNASSPVGNASSLESIPKALLSPRLPHIIHEVGEVKNITEIVRERASKWVEDLKIEEAYASSFAIELVSSSIDVFWCCESNYPFNEIACKLSDILYGLSTPFPGAVSVVVCRIILCEDSSELKTIVENYQLKEVVEGLYIGGENTLENVKHNIFSNLFDTPWRDILILGPVATLKPEVLQSQGHHKVIDELSFLLSMIYSIGKFYVISQSIRGVLARLEVLSWYLDELFEEFESNFCWIKRNFTNLEKHLREIEKDIKSQVIPISRIATSPKSVNLIQDMYGEEYIPHLSSFFSIMENFRIKKYGIPVDRLKEAVLNDLKLLSHRLTEFWKEFTNARNSWKELRRSRITSNQLLISLLGILLTLLINIILKLLF